jgi:hypothetical protein
MEADMGKVLLANRRLALAVALAFTLALALPTALGGCAFEQSRGEVQGGAVGAGVGAVAGALVAGWRGGVIGAALGAVAGATITHIAMRASREAAYEQRPVAYTDDSGVHRVEAIPVAAQGNCRTVVERFYEHDKLVRETRGEVCD